jgi:ADP-ribose pyrophosphatase YjhB (NUDIX family)
MSYIAELRAVAGTRPLILPGAAVIVTDADSRILLLQRADTGGWGLPGGFMEPGELLEETARREVVEEVGLELGELTLMSVFSGPEQYFRYPNGDQVFNVTTVYTARAYRWTMKLDPAEVVTAQLFDVCDLPADLIAPEVPILAEYSRMVSTAGAVSG